MPPTTVLARPPAASVIAECLRLQSEAPPRSRAARFFGRSPLSADARPWYAGALGELEVGRRLVALGPDWRVLHAVPVGDGSSDIDHVVVGPAGVFTLNTKQHEGKSIWVGSKRILVDGQRSDHLRNSRYEAARATKMLTAAIGADVAVTPVLVFVQPRRVTIRERPDDVGVVRETELVGWLRRRSKAAALDPAMVQAITDAAEQPATWQRTPVAGDPAADAANQAAFAQLQHEAVGAARVNRVWRMLLALALVAGIAALLMLGAQVLVRALTSLVSTR